MRTIASKKPTRSVRFCPRAHAGHLTANIVTGWEEDTDISSVAPSRLPPGLVPAFVPQGNDLRPMSQIGGARNPYGGNNNPRAPAQQQQSRGRGSGQAAFRGRGSPVPNRSQPSVRDEVRIQVPFRGVASPTPDGRELRADHSGRGRPVYNPAGRGSFQGPGRRQRTSPEKFMLAKSGAWAEPPTLLTTQRQREQEAKELEEKLRDVYLTPPEEGADPYGVAYIIWGESEAVPTDLLGAGLEELSHIRTAYKVCSPPTLGTFQPDPSEYGNLPHRSTPRREHDRRRRFANSWNCRSGSSGKSNIGPSRSLLVPK